MYPLKLLYVMLLIVVQCSFAEIDGISKTKIIGLNEIKHLDNYRQYFSISIIHFKIPPDTKNVSFVFEAETISQSRYYPLHCDIYNVSVYMKQGALPVISPENARFPATFANLTSRPHVYNLNFLADSKKNYLNITSPLFGDWFGIAFRAWVPKYNQKISVPEMSAYCQCTLMSYAIVTTTDVEGVELNVPIELNITKANESIFKIDLSNKVYGNVNVSFLSKTKTEKVDVFVRPNAIPSEQEYVYHSTLIPRKHKSLILNTDLFPIQYILLKSKTGNSNSGNISFRINPVYNESYKDVLYKIESQSNNTSVNNTFVLPRKLVWKLPSGKQLRYEQHDLIKLSSRKSLNFIYIREPNLDLKTPKMLNLTSKYTVLKFQINGVNEIGGTLYLGFSLNPLRNRTEPYSVVFCIRRFVFEIPALPNKCVYYNEIQNSSLVLNNSSPIGVYENIHIPYPEIGTWYLTIGLFNITNNNTDRCFECKHFYRTCVDFCETNNCKNKCVETLLAATTCLNCDVVSWMSLEFNDQFDDNYNMKTYNQSIIFSIAVSPCIDEACGPHGDCHLIADNSIIFSTCVCKNDYIGWDCSDDSAISTKLSALIEMLLLTLSNLGFIGSIYFAFIRQYYNEATIYFFCMFFSFWYHLCDSGKGIYTYCLLPNDILKFCDFYCGLLSIWLTIIAMANLNIHLKGVFQVIGSVLLALGTTYNMEGILVFIIPVTFGLFIVAISWGLTCRRTLKLYPKRGYLKIYFPFGLLFVTLGITCFAFLETNSNYKFTHSTWHLLMALSIIMLLPSPSALLRD